jgi:peptidyl-prolyl cis-trans isomerase SurA
MKGIRKCVIGIGVLSLGWLFLIPRMGYGEICNRVVAVVNNDVITLFELNNRIKEMTGVDAEQMRAQDENRYLEMRRRILDLLIDEKLAQDKIREQKIVVTDREVDAAIERIKEEKKMTQEDLVAGLKKINMTYEAYRQNIKTDIERMRLINSEVKSKIIVREEKIREYYEAHKSEFSKEERIQLAAIFLKAEGSTAPPEDAALKTRADQILQRLKAGEDFGVLAKEFSQGPGAKEGGDLGYFKPQQLEPELIKAIESLPVGGVSGPIYRPYGIQILKVVARETGGDVPFEQAKAAIYDILYREEINRSYTHWMKELREKAFTKIIF